MNGARNLEPLEKKNTHSQHADKRLNTHTKQKRKRKRTREIILSVLLFNEIFGSL